MDGKQARRTKTSSPLGMMFDHGCDALTTFVFSTGLGTIVGLGRKILNT
jgi:ethanolaminephosphotransferase